MYSAFFLWAYQRQLYAQTVYLLFLSGNKQDVLRQQLLSPNDLLVVTFLAEEEKYRGKMTLTPKVMKMLMTIFIGKKIIMERKANGNE